MRRILLAAMTTVALCDILSAIATRAVGFHFGWRGPFLLVVYVIAGYFARRVAGLKAAMFAGFMSATIDAIAAVLWATGSGRLPAEYTVPNLIAMASSDSCVWRVVRSTWRTVGTSAAWPSCRLTTISPPASRAQIFSFRRPELRRDH
jgi:hypothetical protein